MRVGVAIGAVILLAVSLVWGIWSGTLRFWGSTVTLSFRPASATITVNGATEVRLLLGTGGHDVVATTVSLVYDPTLLAVTGVDTTGSVFPFELSETTERGIVRLSRGIPGNRVASDGVGFRGNEGEVARVTFRGVRAGTATVAYAVDSQVILDDGAGTVLPLARRTLTLTVVPEHDTTPPGPIVDASVTADDGAALLSWINPSDRDLRGVKVQRQANQPVRRPTDGTTVYDRRASPGGRVSFEDTGLANGTTYHYGIFAYDQAGNLSEGVRLEGTPAAPSGDTVPPGRITDLRITAQLVKRDGREVVEYVLVWTAPGDDGQQGRAARYRVHYSTTPYSDRLPDDVTLYSQTTEPREAGRREQLTFTVTPPPSPRRVYYISVRAVDEARNRGPISNVVNTGEATVPTR